MLKSVSACALITGTLFFLTGCGSTPQRDDYAKHINLLRKDTITSQDFVFTLADANRIDLRGMHNQDDTADQSNILYAGDAGIAGMIAQIGIHASAINAQRNQRLAEQQKRANEQVMPLIHASQALTAPELLGTYADKLRDKQVDETSVFQIKPIFFSSAKMDHLVLKLVAWLPTAKSKGSKKAKYRYQNMVQVYSPVLSDKQQQAILEPDNGSLKDTLSSMMVTALTMLEHDITGHYAQGQVYGKHQSFLVRENSGQKVIRGQLLERTCGFQVVQNLHSWLIAIPEARESESEKAARVFQC